MPASLLLACLSGAVSALLHLSLVEGGLGAIILLYLAPLPLLLAGLGLGFGASLVAALAGAVLTAVLGGPWFGLTYLVIDAVPSLLLVRQSLLARRTADDRLEWYPPGLLLGWLTGLGAAAILAAVALAADHEGGLRDLVITALTAVFAHLMGNAEDQAVTLAQSIGPVFPGLVALSWIGTVIVNATLAQGVLMRFGWNRRPPMPVAAVSLPHWLAVALVVTSVVAALTDGTAGFAAGNLVVLLAMPFFFAGLSVVHAFAAARQARLLVFCLFYGVLMLFGWPALFVVGLGVIEQWAGLRRRFARTGPDQEEV